MPDKDVSENIVMESYVAEAAIYSAKTFSPCSPSTEINAMAQPASQVAVALWWFSSAGSQWNDVQQVETWNMEVNLRHTLWLMELR